RPFLKALASTNDLAIYAVNFRLAIPMMIVVTVFDYAWKPFYLSRYNEEGAKELFARVFTYYVLFCSGVFLATSLYIEYLVQLPFIGGRFIEPSYWTGLAIVPVILLAFFINGSQSHFAAGFLITKNTRYVGISVGLGAAVSLILNLILIPYISYWGSAIAIVAGYLVGASNLYIYQRKIYPIAYEWRRVWIIIFSTAIVYFVAKVATLFLEMKWAIVVRTLFLASFAVILYLLKFFTPSELNHIRNLLKLNKKA
ncbi:MAG TPA: oligosaccharide flippase family protein, partial [Candidatus Kapabacteria bacterium]|nr:oligosaccharide flippase family protein [Candidatus Kapabacteria bacterium]